MSHFDVCLRTWCSFTGTYFVPGNTYNTINSTANSTWCHNTSAVAPAQQSYFGYGRTAVGRGPWVAAGNWDDWNILEDCSGEYPVVFRVRDSVSRSSAGTAVDEIMKIEGSNTQRVAKYYIGSTTSMHGPPASKRTRGHDYAHANESPLSQALAFRHLRVSAGGRRDRWHNISKFG